MSDLVLIACLTGFFGDLFLQMAPKVSSLGGPTGWGLDEYFRQHGRVEAMVLAAGLVGMTYIVYLLTGLPVTIPNMFLYGCLLDVLVFHKWMIFPSLKGYYEYFKGDYVQPAIIGGGIPVALPLIFATLLQRR
jgi:hypothetical protein